MPFDRGDECRFLSTDKGTGSFHHFQVQRKTPVEDIVSEQAFRAAYFQRLSDAPDGELIFGPDVKVSFMRTYGVRREDHPFNDAKRIGLQDHAIHKRPGVAFIAVADDVFYFVLRSTDNIPFLPGGKSGSSPAS